MHPVLRLYEDVLSNAETVEFSLPPLARFIFVVHGSAMIGEQSLNDGKSWQGERAVTIKPGPHGVTCWRWELTRGDQGSTVAAAPGMMTHEKLTAFLETIPKGELLMRGDSVSFPPGGCAYTHVHQGPGIRCVIEGAFAHRYPRALDLLRAGRGMVRDRARSRFRAGRRRPPYSIYSRDDSAARAAGAELDPLRQGRGQG